MEKYDWDIEIFRLHIGFIKYLMNANPLMNMTSDISENKWNEMNDDVNLLNKYRHSYSHTEVVNIPSIVTYQQNVFCCLHPEDAKTTGW